MSSPLSEAPETASDSADSPDELSLALQRSDADGPTGQRYVDPLGHLTHVPRITCTGVWPDHGEWLDIDLAWRVASTLGVAPAAAIVHRGVLVAAAGSPMSAANAALRALNADPQGATGATLALTTRVDVTCARALAACPVAIVVARDVDEGALEELNTVPTWRLLTVGDAAVQPPLALRTTAFGVHVQPARAEDVEVGACVPFGAPLDVTTLPAADLALRVVRQLWGHSAVVVDRSGTRAIVQAQASGADALQIVAAKARRAPTGCALGLSDPPTDPKLIELLGRMGVRTVVVARGAVMPANVAEAATKAGIAFLLGG